MGRLKSAQVVHQSPLILESSVPAASVPSCLHVPVLHVCLPYSEQQEKES